MRRALTFACEGAALAATLDEAGGASGLLVVSGGNEVRSGAHRGMAELAAHIAGRGHPVFRFDRRGVGDSEGDNRGFESSGPDIAAALTAFRRQIPQLTRVVAFGNCDAATALILHATPVDARVLANPWVVETVADMPPPAAIKARYAARLRDPAAWRALLSGKIDLGKAYQGLGRLVSAKPATPDSLAARTVRALAGSQIPTTVVLAVGDATAIAFADAWRDEGSIRLVKLDSNSHSFASAADFSALVSVLCLALAGPSTPD